MPQTELITLTDATLAETVRREAVPVVVDFWAEWCPPCGPMARTLAELAPEFAGELLIAKINADENPESMRAHRVLSLPTLLFFSNGVVTSTIVGLRPKSVLRSALASALTPYANV
ncbi:MAG: thioredoxin domain-containing protein [Actinoplanes sp.]